MATELISSAAVEPTKTKECNTLSSQQQHSSYDDDADEFGHRDIDRNDTIAFNYTKEGENHSGKVEDKNDNAYSVEVCLDVGRKDRSDGNVNNVDFDDIEKSANTTN